MDSENPPSRQRRSYSKDLRERVIYQHMTLERKPTQIAVELDMSLRVVQWILQLWNEIGNVIRNPKEYQKRGRPEALNEVACNYMMNLVDNNPDIFLDEIAMELSDTLGIYVTVSTVHRALKLLGYSTKKLSKVALERCETRRQAFLFRIAAETPSRLVFTDKSAVNVLTAYRSMGRAPKGKRAMKSTYFQRGDWYSVLPALTMDGVIYVHVTRGSFDGDSFQQYLAGLLEVMNPYPEKNSVLVMDNCTIHHVEGVAALQATPFKVPKSMNTTR